MFFSTGPWSSLLKRVHVSYVKRLELSKSRVRHDNLCEGLYKGMEAKISEGS